MPVALERLFASLENLPFAIAMRESDFLFPTVETIHVLALTLVVGSIAMMDLRLLGVSSRDRAVSEVTNQVLPWTWCSFVLAAISGFLLFSSAAVKYWAMYMFRAKMALLAFAGCNMLVFHMVTYATVIHWDNHPRPPRAARVAGFLSLLFWISVVVCGRWLGFITTPPPS